MLESKKNNEAEFMIWLSKKVSSNKLSELYMTFQLIEQQARIEQIVEKSLFENMDVGVLEVVISNILQSKFFLSKRKWQRANINFALNFLIQYASATKIQKNGLKLAINSISDRKHIRSDKESFYQWMLNDESMAEASCQDYLSVVNDAERYAVAHSLSDTKFFGVSREKAKATADALFMNADFVEINKKQHDCYGIAITKLLAFLGVDWTVPEGTQGKRGKRYQLEKQNHDIDSISYETVVAQRYQKGYRLNSSIEMKKFRKYYMEINGVELTQQSKFVEDMIRRCGIEHEGRVYAPSTMLSDELRDDLFCYIEETFDSGKNVIYFESAKGLIETDPSVFYEN